jgi:hypothetical protein
MSTPPLLASFAPGEFLIFEDSTCHLGTESDREMSISPSTLILTNRNFVIFTQSPGPEISFIPLSDIASIYEETLYDCQVLTLRCESLRRVHIFMPIERTQAAFSKLLSDLTCALKRDRYSGDSLALSYRTIFLRSRDLADFYSQVEASQTILANPMPIHEFFTPQLAMLIASVFETSELLFLCLVLLGAFVLTLFFWALPFGICFFGAGAAFVILMGLNLAFDGQSVEERIDAKLARKFRRLIEVYEEFRGKVGDRFLWENPRGTLETLMFLLASGLLFVWFEAGTILSLSLVGIAIVERWNPLGFGAPLDLLTELFKL